MLIKCCGSMALVFFSLMTHVFTVKSRNMERIEACRNLNCDNSSGVNVCGIRKEMTSVRLKLFANECALLMYGCSVDDEDAYGLISMVYCNQGMKTNSPRNEIVTPNLQRSLENIDNECAFNCTYLQNGLICGIREDGEGYRVKLFKNNSQLRKYNYNATFPFVATDMFVCEGTLQVPSSSFDAASVRANQTEHNESLENSKTVIVVDSSMLGPTTNANETIENFFAATHVLDLPLREIDNNEYRTRRMLLKYAGPVKVFQPWITIPKKIKTDFYHTPTLSTCYHKCPTQCPDTYSPVCGVPGILAREPSIMFQNHCYMDVAQCKMYWENKSSTAISSSYIESSFLFCLGDQLNGMYRFLPLIKTLQHMGRLRKKAKFRYRLNNMRFFNNYAYKEPKLMG